MLNTFNRLQTTLAQYDYSIEKILDDVQERFDLSETAVFLAGSVMDGLSSTESDIDVLLIGDRETTSNRSMIDEGMVVDTIGLDGGRLQVAQCSKERLEGIVAKIETLLDPSDGTLTNISRPEKRVLHRVCSGNPIYNVQLAEGYKERVGTDRFAKYCLVMHTYAVQAYLKDALGEIRGKHWLSACTAIQIAGTFFGQSKLNEIRETNQNPKWITRLVERHADRLDNDIVELIHSAMFPSRDLANNPDQVKRLYHRLETEYQNTVKRYPDLFTDKGSET